MKKKDKEIKAEISEIFESVQGEGILIGARQLFIRFARCNLRCWYCDTKDLLNREKCIDWINSRELENPVGVEYVSEIVGSRVMKVHSIALTGGEPLLFADFIKTMRKVMNELSVSKPLYLESNMSLPEEAKKIKFVDIVSGDLKIRESGNANYDEIIDNTIKCFRILKNTRKRLTFCKIVLPDRFDADEIVSVAETIKDCVYCFVLQPVFGAKLDTILSLQKAMVEIGDTRLIPQLHKYLGVR